VEDGGVTGDVVGAADGVEAPVGAAGTIAGSPLLMHDTFDRGRFSSWPLGCNRVSTTKHAFCVTSTTDTVAKDAPGFVGWISTPRVEGNTRAKYCSRPLFVSVQRKSTVSPLTIAVRSVTAKTDKSGAAVIGTDEVEELPGAELLSFTFVKITSASPTPAATATPEATGSTQGRRFGSTAGVGAMTCLALTVGSST
jgi:hypothetical protein